MSKKAAEVVATKDLDEVFESIKHQIDEAIGKDILIQGSSLGEYRGKQWATGLLGFDIAFNGGIQEGTIVHLGGLPKVGKTTLALFFAAARQKYGKSVYYIDAENRIQTNLLNKIEGLNLDKLRIIKPNREKAVVVAEEIFSIIEMIVKEDPGCLIILDSLASLCSEEEFSKGMNEVQRATLPKIVAKFLRKCNPIIAVNHCNLITLTHMQANPTGYGPMYKEVGGNAINYMASYWLNATKSEVIKVGDKSVGRDTEFKVMAVAGGAPDGAPKAYIRFDRGVDKYLDVANTAESIGLVKRAGSWYSIELKNDDGEKKYADKFQGMDKLCDALKEKPEIYNDLVATILNSLGIKTVTS